MVYLQEEQEEQHQASSPIPDDDQHGVRESNIAAHFYFMRPNMNILSIQFLINHVCWRLRKRV